MEPVAALVGGGLLGYQVPPLLLARFTRQRRAAIERLLPNAADVLVVSLEAGLGFDTVVAFLAERADNPLTAELRHYLADLRLGRSRREALEALVARTQSPGWASWRARSSWPTSWARASRARCVAGRRRSPRSSGCAPRSWRARRQ